MKVKFTVIIICLLFWPLSLFLANTPTNFLHYVIPAMIIFTAYFIHPSFLLTLPLFEAKLTPLPFLVFLFLPKTKSNLLSLLLSLLLFLPLFFSFKTQTIFHPDHNAYQKVIQDTRLYDNIWQARLMHNKARVYLDKATANFFALTDPNNYFTAFHPREIIVDNQNLKKFPTLSIIFLLFALFNLDKLKNRRLILTLLFAALITLSLLEVFDRTDFILYPLFVFLIIQGINIFDKNKYSFIFYLFFLTLSLIEYLKIFIAAAK